MSESNLRATAIRASLGQIASHQVWGKLIGNAIRQQKRK